MTIKEITAGQDSFLDIVANLVGVLIILVVVVGAQAKQSWTQPEQEADSQAKIERLESEIESASLTAKKLHLDNHRIESKIGEEQVFMEAMANRRHRMLVKLAEAKQEVERLSKKLSEDEKVRFDRQVKRASLESELNELQQSINASQQTLTQRTEVIKHYPTPIAKTVFSDEIHFRLANGKISYVPMDELVRLMKREWKVKAEKLALAPSTIETVGPVGNFRLQYELESVEVSASERAPARMVTRMSHFVVIPVRRNAGEAVAQCLAPGSEFRRLLSGKTQGKTTVSVWLYPDSYEAFNQIKTWLRENQFQTASWPLAEGRPISGSPNGFRTSAQ